MPARRRIRASIRRRLPGRDPCRLRRLVREPSRALVGETDYRLASRLLGARPGDTLLDLGCGTGWFSRQAAVDGLAVTGVDRKREWLDYAREQSLPVMRWLEGDARALPFADASFDHVLSIAALCFIDDERRAVSECVRVSRRRFAIGWLNRSSLLYRQKGRNGGSGAYRGARWRTQREILDFFRGLPVRNLTVRSAIFLPSASGVARVVGTPGTRHDEVGRNPVRRRSKSLNVGRALLAQQAAWPSAA